MGNNNFTPVCMTERYWKSLERVYDEVLRVGERKVNIRIETR